MDKLDNLDTVEVEHLGRVGWFGRLLKFDKLTIVRDRSPIARDRSCIVRAIAIDRSYIFCLTILLSCIHLAKV